MIQEQLQIKNRIQYKEWLACELARYRHSKLDFFLELFNVTESAILRKLHKLLRKTEYLKNTKKKIIAKIYEAILYHFENKFCMHIPLNCFDKGLQIMHVGPILVNSHASIGKNCKLHIFTSIAASGTKRDAPTLGDGVVVGVGASIIGGVSIADNVAIGAGAVVLKDVIEENIAVAGVPAKKISNNGRLEWDKSKLMEYDKK